MSLSVPHLVLVPVLLPLLTAAVLLLLGDQRRRLRSLLNVASTVAGLVVAILLLLSVHDGEGLGRTTVYLASNWQAPFGIVLVADRLSALLLVLVALVASAVALYSEAGWSRAGSWFHPLFQVQLLGLNGAFLTGDLFNLFVFFEVLLAASYGLQLHGSGWRRVRSGMHYLVMNLIASLMFLVGLAVLYGVTGTLSMADLAIRLPQVPQADQALVHIGAAVLAVAFLVKAAVWPLNAWLVPAYTASSAPVAALFALMTKVGVYALLRLRSLVFPLDGPAPDFGETVLLVGGLLTLAFGTLGLMSSIRLERTAAFSVLASSGTLLAAFALGGERLGGAALFYLASATLGASALFLLVELVNRTRGEGTHRPDVEAVPDEDDNLDDDQVPLVAQVYPVPLALLGLAFFTCALLVAGLPPLSGFIAKFALLTATVDLGARIGVQGWALVALLLLSGLFATIALVRAGIRHFWSKGSQFTPRLRTAEGMAVMVLLLASVGLSVFAEPVLRYTRATSASLLEPQHYIEAVMAAQPVPSPASKLAEAAP